MESRIILISLFIRLFLDNNEIIRKNIKKETISVNENTWNELPGYNCAYNKFKSLSSREKQDLIENYIIPIINIPNLDKVMHRVGIVTHEIADWEKGRIYSKIFPINDGKVSHNALEEVKNLNTRLQRSDSSTLSVMIGYCLSIANE